MRRDPRRPEVLAELARDAARLGLRRASRVLAELALQRARARERRVIVIGEDELPRVPRIVLDAAE